MKRKILSAVLAVSMLAASVLGFTSCGTKAKYTVGICQLTQHQALDAATQGFIDYLTEEFGDEIKFDKQNASGDSIICTTIINSFVSKNYDLIMANATPALQAAYSATETVPVLGTSVTAYSVALGLENFNGTVGGNISGTSDLADLEQQAQMIIDWIPDAKNVGLLYCSAEQNSVYQVEVVQAYLENRGITVTRYPFSDTNDVVSVTEKACASSDALYIPTDNKAADCAPAIGNVVKGKGTPVIAGEEGICKECGIATLSISYYDLGRTTGEMAAKILRGEANISDMKIEYTTATKKYNQTICEAFEIVPLEGYEPIA